MLAVGLIAGVLASVLFNLGIALQALEARAAPTREGLHVSLLATLLRRPRWIAGLLLGALGLPFQVAAFALAPFVVVEPLLACGLIVLLAIGRRMLGEQPTVQALVGVAAIVLGTAFLAWGAPTHHDAHRGPVAVLGVMGGLTAASLLPFALKGRRLDGAMAANLASACGFAATNVAMKLLADDLGSGSYLEGCAWLAVAGFAGFTATITGMSALQLAAATTVIPISTAVQTFLPILLEPIFLAESWRTSALDGAPLVVGLLALLTGIVLLARTHPVSALAASSGAPPRGPAPPRRGPPSIGAVGW